MKLQLNIITVIILSVLFGCKNQPESGKKNTETTKDEKFTQLFHQDKGGLTGADGVISVPMPDGSSVFMMGDSFLGEVINNQRDSNTTMINNTFVIVNLEQTATRTLFQGSYNDPRSFIIPENDPGKFYWPGHGFVRDSVFHFFMSRFWIPGEGMWGFEFVSTNYFRYSWPDFKPLSTEPFKYTLEDSVHWGHAVLDDGDYIYIYGCRPDTNNISQAHACRTTLSGDKKLDLENVEFFTGSGWSKDPKATKSMQGTSSNISEQFSIFKYKDLYVLLSQQRGIGTGEIFTYTSKSPVGPWENRQLVYKTTESEENPDIITYNAMAHPQYIENDELLVSYCINALKLPLVFENVDNYRSVFLRVPMDMILGKTN